MAKQLQGFGAPALLLDTLELAANLRPRFHGISASVDGAVGERCLPCAGTRRPHCCSDARTCSTRSIGFRLVVCYFVG